MELARKCKVSKCQVFLLVDFYRWNEFDSRKSGSVNFDNLFLETMFVSQIYRWNEFDSRNSGSLNLTILLKKQLN